MRDSVLDKLKIKEVELRNQLRNLEAELDKVCDSIKDLCKHSSIRKGHYTFNHNDYSQTWSEGSTYECLDCGKYENGHSGILSDLYRR